MARQRHEWVSFALIFFSASCLQAQWIPLNSGTNQNLRSVAFVNVHTGYVVGDSGVILKTANAGISWTSLNSGTSHPLNGVHVFDTDTVIVCGDSGVIVRTTNGGSNWTIVNRGMNVALNGISFFDEFIGISGGQNGTLMRSTDGGVSWVIRQEGLLAMHYGVQMVTTSVGYAGGVNSIFAPLLAKTTDGGASWIYSTFYVQNNEATLRDIYFFNPAEGIAVSCLWNSKGGISSTTDSVMNWTSQIVALGLLGVDFPSGGTGYAVGINGTVLKTTDRGVTWTQQSSGTSVNLWSVSFPDSVNGFVVGDNGTILKTTNGGTTGIKSEREFPQRYFLHQNYPNPFNPTTNISFEVPVSGFVLLKVYDVLGQEVATLVHEMKQAGKYTAVFGGSNLAPGVYFYRLHASNLVETKKLLLVR